MRKIGIALLLLTTTASADVNLFLPLYTLHTGNPPTKTVPDLVDGVIVPRQEKQSFETFTYGLGLEWQRHHWNATASVARNSYDKTSMYLSGGYVWKGPVTYGVSMMGATGYKGHPVYYPIFSAQYGRVRLVTTYPLGHQICATKSCADFFNLQLVFPIK